MAVLDAQELDMTGANSTISHGTGTFGEGKFTHPAANDSRVLMDDQHGAGVTRIKIVYGGATTTARNVGMCFRGNNSLLPNYNGDSAPVGHNCYHLQMALDTDDATSLVRIHRVLNGIKTELYFDYPLPAYVNGDEIWVEHCLANNGDFVIRVWQKAVLHLEVVDPVGSALTAAQMGGYNNQSAINATTITIDSYEWELVALVIDNGTGYNETALTLQVVSTTGIYQGQLYETTRGEHILITDVTSSIKVARVGMNNTTVAIMDDGEILTLVVPDIVADDDLTSGFNWTVNNDEGGTIVFGVGGAACDLDFSSALGLWFNEPIPEGWTTFIGTISFERDELIGLTFATAENNPNQGHPYYNESGQDLSGYSIKKQQTVTQAINRDGPDFIGTTSNLVAIDAITTIKFIASRMSNGKIRFFAFKENTKADTGGTGLLDDTDAHSGEVIVGFGIASAVTGLGSPILKDFNLEVYGDFGGGGNGSRQPSRHRSRSRSRN